MRIKKSSLGVVLGLVLVAGLVLTEALVWAVVPTVTVEKARDATAVSYTHLTLPTIYSV